LAERFLLDENVPSSIIALLKKKRFQVRSVIQAFGPGSSNGRIAEEASRSDEIIITLDSDFLKLHPSPNTRIIIVDVHPAIPSNVARALDIYLEPSVQLLKTARKVKLTKTGPVSIDT
jgi:predicted nuclease of predicted toxin-antitoxin system